jgi:DNA-binding CsgD family transcriptional regulator
MSAASPVAKAPSLTALFAARQLQYEPYWMKPDRIERLTEKQRECLRLVFMHRSSKEIARELSIGVDAVDQRIKTAMRTLDVESRTDAALLLAEHEGLGPYQRLVYQMSDIVPDAVPASFAARANEGARAADEPLAVKEEQVSFQALQWRPARALPFPLPFEGEGRNGLGAWQRVGWIVGIAIATAIGFGVFLSGLQSLARVAQANF